MRKLLDKTDIKTSQSIGYTWVPILADTPQAVSIRACHCSVGQFIHYLRVSRWIEGVHEVLRRDPTCRFRYPIAVAVVHNRQIGRASVGKEGGARGCRGSC